MTESVDEFNELLEAANNFVAKHLKHLSAASLDAMEVAQARGANYLVQIESGQGRVPRVAVLMQIPSDDGGDPTAIPLVYVDAGGVNVAISH